MNERQGSAGNVIAALCSFVIPGLGQLVQGRILVAIVFFPWIDRCVVHQLRTAGLDRSYLGVHQCRALETRELK